MTVQMPVPAPATRRRPDGTGRTARGHGTTVSVRLTDALLSDGLADLRWMLHDALHSGARTVVVDVSGVRRVTSPAVASLVAAHRTCRARGGAVVLRGADHPTLDLLHRTGLWHVLHVDPGTEAEGVVS